MNLFRFNLKNIIATRDSLMILVLPLLLLVGLFAAMTWGVPAPYLLDTDVTIQEKLDETYDWLSQEEALTEDFIQSKQQFDYVESQLRISYDRVYNEETFQKANCQRLSAYDAVMATIPADYQGSLPNYRLDLERSQRFFEFLIEHHQPIRITGQQVMIMDCFIMIVCLSLFSFIFFYWMSMYMSRLREKRAVFEALPVSRWQRWLQPLVVGQLCYFVIPVTVFMMGMVIYSACVMHVNLFVYPVVTVRLGAVQVYTAGMILLLAVGYQLVVNSLLYGMIVVLRIRDAAASVLVLAGTAYIGLYAGVSWLITQWLVFWRLLV